MSKNSLHVAIVYRRGVAVYLQLRYTGKSIQLFHMEKCNRPKHLPVNNRHSLTLETTVKLVVVSA